MYDLMSATADLVCVCVCVIERAKACGCSGVYLRELTCWHGSDDSKKTLSRRKLTPSVVLRGHC